MSIEHFFVTGAMGCIGSWVVRNLIETGVEVTAFDLSENKHRLELIMSDDQLNQINFIAGDLTDTVKLKTTVLECGATHIIHLGALQVPFCKADPPLGAAVNVVGTVNLFEAAEAAGINQLVYASSVAIYGRSELYGELLAHDSLPNPETHYGVYKQANEGTARIYCQENNIMSIGLRPYTVYGPGRDQGLTSTPTKAMLSAVQGEDYHISFGGYNGFQYVDDIAKLFIQSAYTQIDGANVYNIRGAVVHMEEIVSAINAVKPSVTITYEDISLPFPKGQDDTELRSLLNHVPDTSLVEGVQKTMEHFESALKSGLIDFKP